MREQVVLSLREIGTVLLGMQLAVSWTASMLVPWHANSDRLQLSCRVILAADSPSMKHAGMFLLHQTAIRRYGSQMCRGWWMTFRRTRPTWRSLLCMGQPVWKSAAKDPVLSSCGGILTNSLPSLGQG